MSKQSNRNAEHLARVLEAIEDARMLDFLKAKAKLESVARKAKRG